jgi:hypothetical protein
MKILVVLNNNICNNDNNKKKKRYFNDTPSSPIDQKYLSPKGAILSKIFDSMLFSGQFA